MKLFAAYDNIICGISVGASRLQTRNVYGKMLFKVGSNHRGQTMKNLFRNTLFALAAVSFMAGYAQADDRIKANQSVNEFPTLGINEVSAADWTLVYDTSAINWKKVPAAAAVGNSFEDVTATNVLLASECGKLMTLNSATEFVTTLPAPVAGCKFTFIVKAAPSGASYTIVTNASANIIIGKVTSADLNAASDGDISTADDTITIADGVAAVGDEIEMWSDGTSWYYIAVTSVFNGITASQAS